MLDWFKSNILFLSVIAFLLGTIVVKDYNYHNKLQKLSIANTTFKPVMHYTDSKGNSHAQIDVQQVDDKKAFKELKKEIKGANQIQSVTKYVQITDTIFRDIVADTSIDSLIVFKYVDNYINVKSIYSREANKGNIELKSIDTLQYVAFVDKHLFKANELKIDIKNANPYNKITVGNSISISEKKNRLVFGATVAYNPLQNNIVYGVGVMLPIFSIKTR